MVMEQILTEEEFKTKRKDSSNFVLVNYNQKDINFPCWEETILAEWAQGAAVIPNLRIYKTLIFDIGFQVQFYHNFQKYILSFAKISVESIRARISVILDNLRTDITTFDPQEWDHLAKSPNLSTRSLLALNPATPPEYLSANVRDPEFEVRLCTIFNPGTPDDVLFELQADGNDLVKEVAELRGNNHILDYDRFRKAWRRMMRYPQYYRLSSWEFRILCSNHVIVGDNTVSMRSETPPSLLHC